MTEIINTVEEFIKRIQEKKTVSRFEIKLKFEWNEENSKILNSADLSYADLSSADLSYADLSYANLSYAKGDFLFNFSVKLRVV